MKRRLMDLLCCPVCRGLLDLSVFRESEYSVAVPPSAPACSERCELRQATGAQTMPPPGSAECAVCYGREIEEGMLICGGCRACYPIVDAVPRLIRDAEAEYSDFFDRHRGTFREKTGRDPMATHTRSRDPGVFDERSNESFGLQWTNQSAADKTWFKDDASLRKDEFLYSLNTTAAELQGALILDAGCGNGRLTASLADFGGEVVGMELSAGVNKAQAGKAEYAGAREHFVHFIQGNVMELPLRAGRFDVIHTSGVLHHTPSTERAFASFLTAGRPGGRVYVQLYRRREPWVGIPNAVLRGVTSRLPVRLLYRLCWGAVPLHTALVRLVAKLRGEASPIGTATRGERALSLFDNYSPRYQYRYTPQQMHTMFEAAGLDDIRDTTLANEARHMVAFAARKTA